MQNVFLNIRKSEIFSLVLETKVLVSSALEFFKRLGLARQRLDCHEQSFHKNKRSFKIYQIITDKIALVFVWCE